MDSDERESFKQFLLDGLAAYPVEAEVLQAGGHACAVACGGRAEYLLGMLDESALRGLTSEGDICKEVYEALEVYLEPGPSLEDQKLALDAFSAEAARRWTQTVAPATAAQAHAERRQQLEAIFQVEQPKPAGPEDPGCGEARNDTEESRKLKERVLREYGLEIVETVECDDDGNLLLSDSGAKKSPQDQSELNLWRNDNRARVQQASQEMRAKAKAQHEMEQFRIKQQQQLQQQKQQREKQRVAKKERRAGR